MNRLAGQLTADKLDAAIWEGVRAVFESRHGEGSCPDARLLDPYRGMVVVDFRQSGKTEMKTEWLRSYVLRRQIEVAVRETLGLPPKPPTAHTE